MTTDWTKDRFRSPSDCLPHRFCTSISTSRRGSELWVPDHHPGMTDVACDIPIGAPAPVVGSQEEESVPRTSDRVFLLLHVRPLGRPTLLPRLETSRGRPPLERRRRLRLASPVVVLVSICLLFFSFLPLPKTGRPHVSFLPAVQIASAVDGQGIHLQQLVCSPFSSRRSKTLHKCSPVSRVALESLTGCRRRYDSETLIRSRCLLATLCSNPRVLCRVTPVSALSSACPDGPSHSAGHTVQPHPVSTLSDGLFPQSGFSSVPLCPRPRSVSSHSYLQSCCARPVSRRCTLSSSVSPGDAGGRGFSETPSNARAQGILWQPISTGAPFSLPWRSGLEKPCLTQCGRGSFEAYMVDAKPEKRGERRRIRPWTATQCISILPGSNEERTAKSYHCIATGISRWPSEGRKAEAPCIGRPLRSTAFAQLLMPLLASLTATTGEFGSARSQKDNGNQENALQTQSPSSKEDHDCGNSRMAAPAKGADIRNASSSGVLSPLAAPRADAALGKSRVSDITGVNTAVHAAMGLACMDAVTELQKLEEALASFAIRLRATKGQNNADDAPVDQRRPEKEHTLKEKLESLRLPLEGSTAAHIRTRVHAAFRSSLNRYTGSQSAAKSVDEAGALKSAGKAAEVRLTAFVDAALRSIFQEQMTSLLFYILEHRAGGGHSAASGRGSRQWQRLSASHQEGTSSNDTALIAAFDSLSRRAVPDARLRRLWGVEELRELLKAQLGHLERWEKTQQLRELHHQDQHNSLIQVLQRQQLQLEQMQQYVQQEKQPASMSFGAAYRVPDSNLQVAAAAKQGKLYVNVSCLPDEAASAGAGGGILGQQGFVKGVEAAGNLGISLSFGV
ncbi:transmembrane protein [Cystoisospora suis]|uniref:Transmembrane protein n=1 Tax=Cystoisospora suis TaxID=483139 RepID=A0A2C6LHR7_9APIC|nr:transmembrane protein [Cystoisospora suis]